MKEKIIKTGKFAFSKGKFVLMLVGILILLLLIRKVGLDELLAVWNSMNKFYVLLAVVPWVLTIIFGAWRLKKIVNSDIGFFEIFKIYSYGYLLNYASPIQGFGAGAKIAMLRMKKVKVSRSSASIGSEIAYDILVTLLISAIFFIYHIRFLAEQLNGLMNFKLMAIGAVIVIGLAVAAYILRKKEFVRDFFSHLIGSFSLKNMASIFPLTLIIWVLPAIVVYLLFAAAGAKIGLWVILSSLSIGFLLGLATFVPGGLGVRDAITAYIYSISDVPLDMTISIAIFNRFFTIGVVVLICIAINIINRAGKKPGK